MSGDYTEARLERIETKMDRMAEAVGVMARLEERIGTNLDRCEHLTQCLDEMRRRVAKLEQETSKGTVFDSLLTHGLQQLIALGGAAILGAVVMSYLDGAM